MESNTKIITTNKAVLYEVKELKKAILINDTFLPGVCRGSCGLALALLYYARYFNDTEAEEAANKILDQIIDQGLNLDCTYAGGLSGIGWLFDHLQKNKFIDTDDNVLIELDDSLRNALPKLINGNNYDYLHGAIGVGLYLIKKEVNSDSISDLIKSISKYVISDKEGGLKWPCFNPITKENCYNLGLAHGVPSLIIFLCRAVVRNIEKNLCITLIEGTVKYLLKQENIELKRNSIYPNGIFEDTSKNSYKSRLAWCYGDLGVGFALLQAGKTLNNKSLKEKASNIFLETTLRRTPLQTNVKDISFCHGSIGLCHIYYRLFLEYRKPIYWDTCMYWLKVTIRMKRFDDGLCGYKTHYGAYGWSNEYGLLEGIAGIFLVLSTIYSRVEPTWDEYFLLS